MSRLNFVSAFYTKDAWISIMSGMRTNGYKGTVQHIE